MTDYNNERLYKGTLANSKATLYTASTQVIIKAVTLCNKTASTVTANLLFAGVEVVSGYPVMAYDTVTIPFIDQIIENSELIEGFSDTSSALNCYISGKVATA